MVTPQSWCAASIVPLLWVTKMNCTRSLISVTSEEKRADIGLVERRIDLVEQAERRRIQPEDREHQRDRSQRLFAAGEERNRADALARRARHDGDAGREQVIAGQLQIGVSAAEQTREQLLDAGIDAIERFLEARARFLVDLADRAFERFERGRKVGELRVEIGLALRLFVEFLDRGEIDRFEAPDLLLEIGKLALPLLGLGLGRQRVENLVEREARLR